MTAQSRHTVDFGIDLGTTNSTVAVFDGQRPVMIPNRFGSGQTPSAVSVGENGGLLVGAEAKEQQRDAENTVVEFKLSMGTKEVRVLSRAERSWRPEDLSAEVLRALKEDVKRQLGEELRAAVITVPAAFGLDQCSATRAAARLAGIEYAPLVQEPIAAALAYSFQNEGAYWLVYDLGGGTFDAAVVRYQDGAARVVAHAGNNRLGGKLLDQAMIDKLLVPNLKARFALPDLGRGSDRHRSLLAKLKWLAERAKIDLTTQASVRLEDPDLGRDDQGAQIVLECEVQRTQVEELMLGLYRKTVNLCRRALREANIDARDLERTVLVGGSTLMPFVRRMLADREEGLGAAVDTSVDPLLAVALGAARYAASEVLPASLRTTSATAAPSADTVQLEVNLDPVGVDDNPDVGGRVLAPAQGSFRGWKIRFVREGGASAWSGPWMPLWDNGGFLTDLLAERGRTNNFRLELQDHEGVLRPTEPEDLTYRVDVLTPDPPLPHFVGIGLADNGVEVYFERNTRLPARHAARLSLTRDIERGREDQSVRVPVLEGMDPLRADRNRRIGALVIPAKDLPCNLRKGTAIDVLLEIDRSRQARTSAHIEGIDAPFSITLDFACEPLTDAELKRRYREQKQRMDAYLAKARGVRVPQDELVALKTIRQEALIEMIEDELSAASHGDREAAYDVERLLNDFATALDALDGELEWPVAVVGGQEALDVLEQLIERTGEDHHTKLDVSRADLGDAVGKHDLRLLQQKTGEIKHRWSVVWVDSWPNLVERFKEAKNAPQGFTNQERAQQLVARGEQALPAKDKPALRSVVSELEGLLTRKVETRPVPAVTPRKPGGKDDGSDLGSDVGRNQALAAEKVQTVTTGANRAS